MTCFHLDSVLTPADSRSQRGSSLLHLRACPASNWAADRTAMPKMGAQYCSSCSARPADGMASMCCYCCKCAFLRHSHCICTGSEGIELPVSQMTLVTCPGTSARGPPNLHHPTKRQLSRSASGLGASMHLHVEFRIDWHCNTLQSCALIANGQSLCKL